MPRKYLLDHVEEMFGEGVAIDKDGRLTETAVTDLECPARDDGTRGSSRDVTRGDTGSRHAADAGHGGRGGPGDLS
jgi:hypothetical protein